MNCEGQQEIHYIPRLVSQELAAGLLNPQSAL